MNTPLVDSPETVLALAWGLLHFTGLGAAWLTRLDIGHLAEHIAFGLLGVVFLSIAAVAAHSNGDEFRLWILSGTTMGIMIVAAVADCRCGGCDPLLAKFAGLKE